MRPRRTKHTQKVFSLPGGNEDNDLWVRHGETDGRHWLESTWELDDVERAAIAAGGTIQLRTWGVGTPPVSIVVGPSMDELAR